MYFFRYQMIFRQSTSVMSENEGFASRYVVYKIQIMQILRQMLLPVSKRNCQPARESTSQQEKLPVSKRNCQSARETASQQVLQQLFLFGRRTSHSLPSSVLHFSFRISSTIPMHSYTMASQWGFLAFPFSLLMRSKSAQLIQPS